MDLSAYRLVRPLREAESAFLQLLVTRFRLQRRGEGTQLEIHFDNDTPAIWTRRARREIHDAIPDFQARAAEYQAELDAFLVENRGFGYEFDKPDFPFRYASGGALPILRMGTREYYCLFYRDVFPVGWNIANGGCDTRAELLNPFYTVERELREELIAFDIPHRKRYVFLEDVEKPPDYPEFAVARKFWEERVRDLDFHKLQQVQIPLKWLDGPDSVEVHVPQRRPEAVEGCFLNINAEDFGIEIDRIAKINLDEDVTLCDGEVMPGRLVNTPVGLFEVDKMNRALAEGRDDFIPDRFFHSALPYDADDFENIIHGQFLPDMAQARTQQGIGEVKDFEKAKHKFGLCPATRGILRRHISLQKPRVAQAAGPFEVFISFGGEDETLAAHVYHFLRDEKRRKVFFSKEAYYDTDYSRMIDDALVSARVLIAVASDPRNLRRSWPDYECRAFHVLMRNRRKENARIIPFVSGFEPEDLPLPLCTCQAVRCDPNDIERALEDLAVRLA